MQSYGSHFRRLSAMSQRFDDVVKSWSSLSVFRVKPDAVAAAAAAAAGFADEAEGGRGVIIAVDFVECANIGVRVISRITL